MDPFHDPHHRDELLASESVAAVLTATPLRDKLVSARRQATNASDSASPARFSKNEDTVMMTMGDSQVEPTSSGSGRSLILNERLLANSWLLILVVAPLLIVLLVWLLILLRRRLKSTKCHLVIQNPRSDHHRSGSYYCCCASSSQSAKAKRPIKSSKEAKFNNDYLISTTSSTGSTSSASASEPTSSSDNSTSQASPKAANSNNSDGPSSPSTSVTSIEESTSVANSNKCDCPASLEEKQLIGSNKSILSLIDHMFLYLNTITYLEIFACLIAFLLAILNIIRMRSLFCCNLIIFLLLTSKFLNLVTLTTFSVTKLFKLLQLRPIRLSPLGPNHGLEAEKRPRERHHQQQAESARHQRCSLPTAVNMANNSATISRLIVKQQDQVSRRKAIQHQQQQSGETIYLKLVLLVSISASLALICLYSRLMPIDGELFASGQLRTLNRSLADPDHWSITIYPTTTSTSSTTEASTRYTSLGGAASEQQEASAWASLKSFQATSHLKQLIDSYELAAFANILFDTQLQSSRFSCTLIGQQQQLIGGAGSRSNQSARFYVMFLYMTLMLFILMLSILIQKLGHNKLESFEAENSKLLVNLSGLANNQRPSLAATNQIRSSLSYNNLLGSSRQFDSNRKRYSELLKQSIRHQSTLELLQSHHKRSSLANLSKNQQRSRLRQSHSSSMSSLLAPLSSCGSDQNSHERMLSHNRRQLLNSPHTQTSQKSSLAWLPLGNAATVASLSNMGCPLNQQQRGKLASGGRLSAIGEQERNSTGNNESGGEASTACCSLANNMMIYERTEMKANSNKQHLKKNKKSKKLSASKAVGEDEEAQEAGGESRRGNAEREELYSSQRQHLLLLKLANKNKLHYVELKKDLSLTQSIILFGQLLNHAPILILLALANLLPDGLLDHGWNSSHDNGFVWLILIEALLLPVILCTVDSRICMALKRSLKYNSCHHLASNNSHHTNYLNSSYHRTISDTATTTTATSSDTIGTANKRPPPPTSGFAAANQHYLNQTYFSSTKPPLASQLVLGSSASFPDFMFVGPAAARTKSAQTNKQTSCHSLTGPPYLLNNGGTGNQLAIDTQLSDTIRANFSLMSRDDCKRFHGAYKNQESTFKSIIENRRKRSAATTTVQVTGRHRNKRTTNAILNATRKLFKLNNGNSTRLNSRRRGGGLKTLQDTDLQTFNCPGNNAADLLNGAGGSHHQGMSPTSSLSTLIRKFNHDNYTSVCQLYDQQRKQVASNHQQNYVSESAAAIDLMDAAKPDIEGILIDGLDESIKSNSTNQQQRCLLDGDEVFCRKGGLSYNYCLQETTKSGGDGELSATKMSSGGKQTPMSRINPMHKQSLQATTKNSNKPPANNDLFKTFNPNEKPQQPKKVTEAQAIKNVSNELVERKADVKPVSQERLVVSNGAAGVANSPASNNETIMSNVTSVQELLDRMNGIMEDKPANDQVGKPSQLLLLNDSALSSKLKVPKDPATNQNKQANQLARQQHLIATNYDSLNRQDTLDYGSLRSFGYDAQDGLSLVSVSSEFEYHNIYAGGVGVATAPAAPAIKQPQVGLTRAQEADVERPSSIDCRVIDRPANSASEPPKSGSDSSSASIDSRQLENSRFPSFLPTKSKATGELQAKAPPTSSSYSSKLSSSAAPKRQQASGDSGKRIRVSGSSCDVSAAPNCSKLNKLPSSSLLNLTTAKFAALSSLQQPAPLIKSTPKAPSVSSNTITKQKRAATGSSNQLAGANKAAKLITMAEFGKLSGQQQQSAESSLPAESGNVRARIRKMEQQQSTPNLSQQLTGQPMGARQQLKSSQDVAALLPSRLPVMIGGPSSSPAGSSSSTNNTNSSTRSSQRLILPASRGQLAAINQQQPVSGYKAKQQTFIK